MIPFERPKAIRRKKTLKQLKLDIRLKKALEGEMTPRQVIKVIEICERICGLTRAKKKRS